MSWNSTKQFSADTDLSISRGNKPRKGQVHVCSCGQKYYRSPYHAQKFKKSYCSRDCSNKGKMVVVKTEKICEECSNKYLVYPSYLRVRANRYCSVKCRGASITRLKSGENSPAWKGGISKESRRIRASKRFKDWRNEVFERDNYTCQDCGVRGGYLEPHHIKPFAYFPELRFELSNGQTLCNICHKKTDSWGHKSRMGYPSGN